MEAIEEEVVSAYVDEHGLASVASFPSITIPIRMVDCISSEETGSRPKSFSPSTPSTSSAALAVHDSDASYQGMVMFGIEKDEEGHVAIPTAIAAKATAVASKNPLRHFVSRPNRHLTVHHMCSRGD